jgi:membrane dipeptidase
MDRRRLLMAGAALPLAWTGRAFAGDPIYIADMHFHLFFFGPNAAAAKPLAANMAAGKATLVSWSLIGDLKWLRPTPRGVQQNGVPAPGATLVWFEEELARIKAHIADQNLKLARAPADVDRALEGEPHVVISIEGPSFVDGDLSQLEAAYDAGVRHVQIVHYIRNEVGDFQTERPMHGGLSAFGKAVVRECNRLGMLVDLAHCTSDAVDQALAISAVPMVWSHSSVSRTLRPHWSMPGTRARQLRLRDAKAIAANGGVIGLWALGSDVGGTPAAYADRLMEMADWLGVDHVAFGTDMNVLRAPAIATFADLRRVIEHWQRQQVSETSIRKIAIENYARVLKQAMAARGV